MTCLALEFAKQYPAHWRLTADEWFTAKDAEELNADQTLLSSTFLRILRGECLPSLMG
jgi:hypothetical protein